MLISEVLGTNAVSCGAFLYSMKFATARRMIPMDIQTIERMFVMNASSA